MYAKGVISDYVVVVINGRNFGIAGLSDRAKNDASAGPEGSQVIGNVVVKF